MFKRASTSSLAYKKEENDNQEEDIEDEMGLLEFLARIILFPIAVPIFMIYITFFARGTPIAAELDFLDAESDGSFESEEDYITNWERAISASKALLALLCCKNGAVNESFSYEAFMSQKQSKIVSSNVTKPNTYKYEPAVDVARTDRVEYEEDGVFIKNFWVPLNDIKTMETLLGDMEKEALIEEETQERDEWDSSRSVKGEAKRVIEDLLQKAKNRQGIHPSSPSKQSSSGKPSARVLRKPSTPSNESAVNVSVSTADTTSITNTPSSKKNYKPKKGHLPEGTPLAERMNLQRVASDHQVDGPSVDLHVPESIMKSSPGSP